MVQPSSTRNALQARSLPLGLLQEELRRSGTDALAGDPETVLRSLPPGYGGVVRLPRDATGDLLTIRAALREAASNLRFESGERGLLATASREEGLLVSLYFWYTGDAAETPERTPPAGPLPSAHCQEEPLQNERSLAEAAAELGVSAKTIRRAIKAGRIPARLVPGPRGPEYRVDIRSLRHRAHPDNRDGSPPPRASGSSATQQRSPSSPQVGAQETLAQLTQRLDALETELQQLRDP